MLCIALGKHKQTQMWRRYLQRRSGFDGARQCGAVIQIIRYRLPSRRPKRGNVQDLDPPTRTEPRGISREMQPSARLNQSVPRRILEAEFRGRRVLPVVDDPASSRLGTRFVKHQPQPSVVDPAHPTRVYTMTACLTVDDTAERPDG